MTSQMTRFIELSDIVALRFACAHCKASLSLSLSKDVPEKRLRTCPMCNEPWAQLQNGSTIEATIAGFAESTRKLVDFLCGGHFPGFSMTVELKEESKARLPGE